MKTIQKLLRNTEVYSNKGEKQRFADVLQNRCYQKFRNIHRKTPVLESLLTAVFIEPLRWLLLNIDTNRLRFHKISYGFKKMLGMEQSRK